MKQKALFVIFLLISLSCFGMKKFTIPKEDFLKQFSSGSIRPMRVYCYREDGSRMWFFYNKGSIQLEFYQAWLTESGFLGTREEKGRMYWYEGQ